MSVGIPISSAEVTAAWLSKALSTPEAQTRVASVEHQTLVRGAGTKLALRLDYADNPRNLPHVLWIKVGWEDHSPMMVDMGVHAREALYYEHFAPLINVRAPIPFWVEQDKGGQSAIILEDLHTRGSELWTCTVARSVDDVRSLLTSLAHLHARFWEDSELIRVPGIDVVINPVGPSAAWFHASGGDHLHQIIQGPRGKLMPSYARSAERIEKAFWRMVETLDRRNGRCLTHCDPHPGNCFSDPDGAAGLYDWQMLSRGPWAFDVSYAVTAALDIEDRRMHERSLLAHYLNTLGSLGVKTVPGLEEAWGDYCRYIAYPLLVWPTNRSSHQADENSLVMTERMGAAAVDFQVFERWGV